MLGLLFGQPSRSFYATELIRLVGSGSGAVRRELAALESGLAEPLKLAPAPLAPKIIAAFVYGSVAKQTDTASSDIDLLLLSEELSYGDVFGALDAASTALGRTVNPTILTRKEFAKRLKAQESFLSRVLEQPKVWIIGGGRDLSL